MTLYTFLKFLHVLLVIIAVGFNASYGIWLRRAAREPDHELHVLKGIKILDDRFANPAYALILVTGLAMVVTGDVPLTTFWIAAGLVLYAVVAVLGLAVYTPTLRRQIAILEAGGRSEEYAWLSKRAGTVGGVLAVLVVVIVFLMVTKPTF